MKNVGLSMIGGGFMGKLHTLAIQSYPVYYYPPAVNVFKECVVDVNPAVAEMSKTVTDLREVLQIIMICLKTIKQRQL